MVEIGRRERGDAARKFEYLGMCKLEGRREIEFARLRLNGLHDGRAAMARIGAPQARRGVQNGRSVGLVIIHVLRAGEQARLALELEYAIRLSENLNHGGSADRAESRALGAEAMALGALLGERVPRYYAHLMEGRSVGELAGMPEESQEEMEEWVQWRNEATVAVQRIAAQLRQHSGRTDA